MTRQAERPLRADARRNRDRILAAAVRLFAEPGPAPTFDRIAKEAGVGIATLYRNFPTREALVEAAYRSELVRLCDAAPGLLASGPARAALRAWTGRFLDYTTAKAGMADALRAAIDSGRNPYAHSREAMLAALTSLLTAGRADGTLRADVTPEDVFAALTGVALAAGGQDQREQAERLLDLLLDGLATP